MSIGLPGPTSDVPPAGIVVGVVPGDVRIARQGMADQHGVVALRVELAVGLVGHGHFAAAARRVPAPAARET